MRKLAPLFITTSIFALAAGNALANNTSTMNSTDKTGSPTVSDNTNKQPLSYSDKSNTAKGTNARMDDKAGMTSDTAAGSTADATTDKVNPTWASDEDKNANIETGKTMKKAKKDKVASHTKHHKHVAKRTTPDTTSSYGTDTAMPSASSSTTSAMPAPTASSSTMNPPLSGTKGEAANSMTGKSAGQ